MLIVLLAGEYFEGLAAAYREEIDELYSLGCRIIQIDDPLFCFGCDESVRARVRDIEGTDPVEEVQLYIEAINMITKDRPDDLVIGLHMCRGNWPTAAGAKAAYFTGSYNWLATEGRVFERLDVDALYLEFDSDRCGDFTPLATVQKNKMIVLGLVTTKDPKMESKQELKDRIFEAVSAMSAEGSGRSKEEALNQYVPDRHVSLRKRGLTFIAGLQSVRNVASHLLRWAILCLLRFVQCLYMSELCFSFEINLPGAEAKTGTVS